MLYYPRFTQPFLLHTYIISCIMFLINPFTYKPEFPAHNSAKIVPPSPSPLQPRSSTTLRYQHGYTQDAPKGRSNDHYVRWSDQSRARHTTQCMRQTLGDSISCNSRFRGLVRQPFRESQVIPLTRNDRATKLMSRCISVARFPGLNTTLTMPAPFARLPNSAAKNRLPALLTPNAYFWPRYFKPPFSSNSTPPSGV